MNRDGIKKILKLSILLVAVTSVLGYSFFTFRDYINGPEIVISEPQNGSTLSTSTVMIRGIASRIQDITINNKPILIDKQGNFSYNLLLFPGYNASIISVTDKFKRTIEYKLELVYKN